MAPAQENAAQSAAERASSIGALSAAAILLLVIAAGSLGWAVWQLRADARRDAYEETGNLALVLAVSALFGAAARRCGQPAVVGQMLAGILLGRRCSGACPGT